MGEFGNSENMRVVVWHEFVSKFKLHRNCKLIEKMLRKVHTSQNQRRFLH